MRRCSRPTPKTVIYELPLSCGGVTHRRTVGSRSCCSRERDFRDINLTAEPPLFAAFIVRWVAPTSLSCTEIIFAAWVGVTSAPNQCRRTRLAATVGLGQVRRNTPQVTCSYTWSTRSPGVQPECSPPCKIQGQLVKEVTLSPSGAQCFRRRVSFQPFTEC